LVGGPTVPARPVDPAPELPRSLYHCCLDDQPDFLVPERYLPSGNEKDPPDRRLVINPKCFFTGPGEIPEGESYPGFTREHFACGSVANSHQIAWVRDSATGALMPFWLGPELNKLFADAQPGDAAPLQIPKETICVLKAAGVLVEEDHANARREEWQLIVLQCRAQFRAKGYVPIGCLIHPFHIAAMRRYYRHHLRRGNFNFGDSQTLRYTGYNEPVAKFFHQQLTAGISDVVGEEVKPSYCYFSSYPAGACLEKHTDREQCEFTISLCIDYSPEPKLATPWPLQLHIDGGTVTVFQALGDALLYRGRQIPHSRSKLGEGQSSTSIFFHYVRKDFTGPLG
jgi:hypothetical protein